MKMKTIPMYKKYKRLRDIYCKGCHTYHYKECSITPINKDRKCPCIQCLVKPMCVQGCAEFVNYTNDRDKETKTVRISAFPRSAVKKMGELLFEHYE